MANMDKIFIGTDPTFPPGTEAVPGVAEFRASHPKGDYIVDMHLAYQSSDAVKISFVVKNLFNRAYMVRPALLGPPESFMLQMNIRI